MTRRDALAKGLKRYKGKRCPKHPLLDGLRYTTTGRCIPCSNESCKKSRRKWGKPVPYYGGVCKKDPTHGSLRTSSGGCRECALDYFRARYLTTRGEVKPRRNLKKLYEEGQRSLIGPVCKKDPRHGVLKTLKRKGNGRVEVRCSDCILERFVLLRARRKSSKRLRIRAAALDRTKKARGYTKAQIASDPTEREQIKQLYVLAFLMNAHVHHIIPRGESGSAHRLWNLKIMMPDEHEKHHKMTKRALKARKKFKK